MLVGLPAACPMLGVAGVTVDFAGDAGPDFPSFGPFPGNPNPALGLVVTFPPCEGDKGFAQGGATSPLLSIYAKSKSKIMGYKHIMYADDGLLLDVPKDFEPTDLEDKRLGI